MKRNELYLWPAFAWTVLLPIFGYLVLQAFYTKTFHDRIIDLIIFTGRFEEYYSKSHKKPYTQLRNYHEIHFTGDTHNDNIKLNYARIRIHEILQQQDTINGVHFTFGDSSRYVNFINALDVLRLERAEAYFVDKGDIWFLWPHGD